MATARQLADLISIGPAMLRDFDMLGINSVAELAKQEPFGYSAFMASRQQTPLLRPY